MAFLIRNKILPAFAALAVICAGACKKSDDEKTKSYLKGSLSVGYIPPYSYAGDSLTFTLSGVSYPSSDTDASHTLGAYYSFTGISTSPDTVFNAITNPYTPGCSFKIRVPDTLATLSILVSIYPSADDKYYTSSHTSTVVVVDDLRSIPEISPYRQLAPEIFKDPRDNREYAVVNAGGLKWLNRNLAYAGTASNPLGLPYAKSDCMNYVFGRYYNWNEAQMACPEGWRLPSSQDWDCLGKVSGDLMVDAYFNGSTRLWEYWPDVKITNKTMMGFIPAGYCNNVSFQFNGTLEYATFWTNEKEEVEQSGRKMQLGVYRYVFVRDGEFKRGLLDPESVSMPVRCVKN